MGLMDKAKGLLKGREKQVKGGIDAVSKQVGRRAGKHAGKVDDLSAKAKQTVDTLSGGATADVPSAGTPPTSTPSTATPPTRTTPAATPTPGTTPTAAPPSSTTPGAPPPDAPAR